MLEECYFKFIAHKIECNFSEGEAEKRSTFAFWEVCRQNCSAFSFSKFLCESLEFVISSWDWGNNKSKQEILIG